MPHNSAEIPALLSIKPRPTSVPVCTPAVTSKGGRPSSTAVTATTARAAFSGRVSDDVLAHHFLGWALRLVVWVLRGVPALLRVALWIGDRIERGVGVYIPLRTVYIDAAVVRAIDAGIDQVVILGAGYDSRAWRLAKPGVTFFEIDLPATQAEKKQAIANLELGANATLVPVDFAVDDLALSLLASGFESTRPTLFIWEGVTMFLPRQAVRETIDSIHFLAAPGSQLVVDFNYPKAKTLGCTTARALGEPCRFDLEPNDAARFLQMSVCEIADAKLLRERHLRDSDLAGRHVAQPSYLVTASVA